MSSFTKAMPPFGIAANRRSPVLLRFYSKVRLGENGCWLWDGWVGPNGYGQFGDERTVYFVHRWIYEHANGPIPAGLHIDHLCRVRNCVNPRHLEAVTQAENNQRMWDHRPKAAHCRRGHDLSVHGRASDGDCKVCHAERARRYRRARKNRGN